MPDARTFDAIVVGSGQAGPPLVGRLASAGLDVALVERNVLGGTCVNFGCTPTKALVASAKVAQQVRRAAEYGVIAPEPQIDLRQVIDRKARIVEKSRRGLEKWIEGMERCTLIREHARFEEPGVLRVGDQRIRSERIFLDVGARARIPDLPGLGEIPYLTNTSIMELDAVPDHLVVVGGGAIGLEFAQMFRRFGSQVTLVERGPRLLRREDEDVAAAVLDILQAEGIDVRLEAECISVEPSGAGVRVGLECDGDRSVEGSHLLLAVGRQPNTDELGLDAAGIDTDERGMIQVDDQLRTNVEGVWALGDCNGQGAFTHTAYNDFEIVAANLLDDDPRRVSDRIDCYATYIDPPLARVGMTEAEARETGRKLLLGTRPMTKVSRAVEKGETQGLMKVVVDAETERILGATILGVGGDEAIHCILDVMLADAPYTVISRGVHIHPTVAELIPTVLQGLKPA